jgi:hypothetical protein
VGYSRSGHHKDDGVLEAAGPPRPGPSGAADLRVHVEVAVDGIARLPGRAVPSHRRLSHYVTILI